MLISSPEKIADFIYAIPKGSFFTIKELRRGLALKAGADKTCPVTTGIFLRMAIEQNKDDVNFPYWRVIDETPSSKKLNLDRNLIQKGELMRAFFHLRPKKELLTLPSKNTTLNYQLNKNS